MTLNELTAQVVLGEDSRCRFKQDMHSPDALVAEMAVFANADGGVILLGVAHDGSLPIAARNDAPRWPTTLILAKAPRPYDLHQSPHSYHRPEELTSTATHQWRRLPAMIR